MSGLNMTKGESISLSKKAPGLTKVMAAAGWDAKQEGATMDLDLVAYLLTAEGKLRGSGDVVFFNNLKSGDASCLHQGDNLTGAGDGDDEIINVDLTQVDASIQEIVFAASIYDSVKKGQALKDLDNAFIRIVNVDGGAELAKFTISTTENGASFTLGKLVRNGSDWDFVAIGEVVQGDMSAYTNRYGLTANAA